MATLSNGVPITDKDTRGAFGIPVGTACWQSGLEAQKFLMSWYTPRQKNLDKIQAMVFSWPKWPAAWKSWAILNTAHR